MSSFKGVPCRKGVRLAWALGPLAAGCWAWSGRECQPALALSLSLQNTAARDEHWVLPGDRLGSNRARPEGQCGAR